MKKILCFIGLALALSSCKVDTYNWENPRNWRNLKNYTDNVMHQFLITPATDLSLLLDIDEYMKLSEEEQKSPLWADQRSKIRHYSETRLKIPSAGMDLDTRGVSLDTPGSCWLIDIYDSYMHSRNSGYDYYCNDQYTDAPGHCTSKRVTCIGDGVYEVVDVKNPDAMKFTASVVPAEGEGYGLSGICSGVIAENDNGLSAAFNIDEFYYRRFHYTTEGPEGEDLLTSYYRLEKTHLRVETFNGGTLLDWCELLFDLENISKENPYPASYTSNMEIYDIPHNFPLD